MKKPHGDPRKAGGDISGPGSPHERHGVVVDATDAVLLEDVMVTLIEPYHQGKAMRPGIALQLSGRVNKTQEQSRVLYLFNEDGAAAIISELLGLAQRSSGFMPDFMERLMERLHKLP